MILAKHVNAVEQLKRRMICFMYLLLCTFTRPLVFRFFTRMQCTKDEKKCLEFPHGCTQISTKNEPIFGMNFRKTLILKTDTEIAVLGNAT